MHNDDTYYVLVQVEDEKLRFVADKSTNLFLNHNFRLESIFQKYNEAYNATFKERISAKSLQVMNQNRKPIFSSMTPSGMISSPRCLDVRSKKDVNHQLRTPLKNSSISLSTERKRLSFDDAENDGTELSQAFLQTSDDSQLLVNNCSKQNVTSNELIADKIKTVSRLDTSPPLTIYGGESNISYPVDNYILEKFNFEGKPETITSLSIYNTDAENSLHNTPDKHHKMVMTPEEKSRTILSDNIGESRGKHIESSSSFLNLGRESKPSDSPDAHNKEMFSLEGKPGTTTAFAIHVKDTPCLSSKTPDKLRTMVPSCGKNITPVNNSAGDGRSVKHLVISPSLFSYEEKAEVSDQPNANDQESFRPDGKPEISLSLSTEHKEAKRPETSPKLSIEHKEVKRPETSSKLSIEHKEAKRPETSPRLSIEHEEVISMTYKTPDKCETTMFSSVKKKERTHMNQNGDKRVIMKTTSNEKEFLSPMADRKTPNNPKVNKRKSPDYLEEAVINTCLVAENQEYVAPPKIAKLDDVLTTEDKKIVDPTDYSTIDDKDSFNPAGDSSMGDKYSFNHVDRSANDSKASINLVDESAMNGNVSFNPADNSAMDGKVSFNPADNSTMDGKVSFNLVNESAENGKVSLNPADNSAMDGEVSFNLVDESAMNGNVSFNPADESAMDDKDGFNRAGDNSSMGEMFTVRGNNTDIHTIKTVSPFEKSEWTTNVSAYYCALRFSPKCDQEKKIVDNSDISSTTKCKIRISSTVALETTDVESLTSLIQNLSPSVKRSIDGSSQKPTNRSISDKTSFAKQLCLRDNLSKTTTPPRDFIVPKPDDKCVTKAKKFCESVSQSKKRLSIYRRLFTEDTCDLRFIYIYLNIIANIVKVIPAASFNAELVEIVEVFLYKSSKLLEKLTLWKGETEKDLEVLNDCFTKITEHQQELIRIHQEKTCRASPKDFTRWESSIRAANRKADEMILLRDIRRPTILQFGHELENLIQLLIRCLLILGLIKRSSKISTD